MTDTAPNERLAAAAEELLKAAGVEASTELQKKLVADLVSFKKSVDAKLNTINQSLVASRERADDKASSLEQRIGDKASSLEQRIGKLEDKVAHQTKLQNLAFAIQNATVNEFEYIDETNNSFGTRSQSSSLVRTILLSFRRGFGSYLPKGKLENVSSSSYDKSKWEESTKAFRNKVVNQIHGLTGRKPRLDQDVDGSFVIYYS